MCSMKVLVAQAVTSIYIETDEDEYNEYTRHSPENWMNTMGMSEETVSYTEKLEEAFQAYIKEHPDEV